MVLADAVLFDFHGTLAVGRSGVDVLGLVRPALAEPALSRLAEALTAAGLPGGPYPARVPAELQPILYGVNLRSCDISQPARYTHPTPPTNAQTNRS